MPTKRTRLTRGRRGTRTIDDLELSVILWLISGWTFKPAPPSGWPSQWPWPPPWEYHDSRPTEWDTLEDLMEDYPNFRDSFLASNWATGEMPWVERQYRQYNGLPLDDPL
jgi:hypothetical protein